jgi:hypothetical protein
MANKARWEHAVKIAKTLNKLIKAEYLIYDLENQEVKTEHFEICEEHQEIRYVEDEHCTIVYFGQGWGGLDETIKEYDEHFKNWIVIPPKKYEKFLTYVKGR